MKASQPLNRQIGRYFLFFSITLLIYRALFYTPNSSTTIPQLPLNSGQQSIQLQFIEITQSKKETVKTKSPINPPPVKQPKKRQTAKKVTTTTDSAIKIAAHPKKEEPSKISEQIALPHKIKTETAKPTKAVNITPEKLTEKINKEQQTTSIAEQNKTKKSKAPNNTSSSKTSSQKNKGVLQQARVVSGNSPRYPKRAILRNQQGRVVVKLTVTTQGKAKNLQIISSSGYPILDRSIIDFVKKSDFIPTLKNNQKIVSEQLFSFRFELK